MEKYKYMCDGKNISTCVMEIMHQKINKRVKEKALSTVMKDFAQE